MEELYEMIFKRKSIRIFKNNENISNEELNEIYSYIEKLEHLVKDIKVDFKIVKKEKTTCKRGEFCLLMYSEEKPLYLLNAGYILEQIDLYMAKLNIGACWYGMGKVSEENYNGLNYVIMLAFGKCKEEEFRKDYTKAKRKELEEIWKNNYFLDIANIVRYAPSACNSQPWRIVSSKNELKIYREEKIKSLMRDKSSYYNSIDMGVFLLFLDIILKNKNYTYTRKLLEKEVCPIKIATYTVLSSIKNKNRICKKNI